MNVQVKDRSDAHTMGHAVIYLYFPSIRVHLGSDSNLPLINE